MFVEFYSCDQKYFITDKIDVFSLGIIFYALLAKETPFTGSDNSEILLKNKQCQIPIPEIFNEDYYEEQEIEEALDLLKKMLSPDP